MKFAVTRCGAANGPLDSYFRELVAPWMQAMLMDVKLLNSSITTQQY